MNLAKPDLAPPRPGAAALLAVLAADGCSQEADDRFRVTRVELESASTITLTFSEPLAELGPVDPADFRISIGRTGRFTYTYGGQTITYSYTLYTDPGPILADYDVYQDLTVVSVLAGDGVDQLVLTTNLDFVPTVCEWVEYQVEQAAAYIEMYGPDAAFQIGLFLHYAGSDVPITAVDGAELADIAPDWASTDAPNTERDGFGFIQRPLPIPCP